MRWELEMWGRISRNMEAASSEAVALEMDRRGVILALISDVGQAYFRLLQYPDAAARDQTASQPEWWVAQ